MVLFYELDPHDRIRAVSPGWDDFALANDGAESCAEKVVGTSLWDHVKDAETRYILGRLLPAVRVESRTLEIPFNCHGPDQERALMFEATPLGHDAIRITTRTLRQAPWTAPVLNRRTERSQDILQVCSWCSRGTLDGAWLALDRWTELRGLFLAPRLPRLSHGICPDCAALINAQVDGDRQVTSLPRA